MDGGRQVPRTQPSRTPRRHSSFASPSAPHAPLLPRPPSPSRSSKPPLFAATDAASRAPQAAAVPVPIWSVLAEATSPDLCRVAPSSPARTAPLLRPDWQSAAVSPALTDAKSPRAWNRSTAPVDHARPCLDPVGSAGAIHPAPEWAFLPAPEAQMRALPAYPSSSNGPKPMGEATPSAPSFFYYCWASSVSAQRMFFLVPRI